MYKWKWEKHTSSEQVECGMGSCHPKPVMLSPEGLDSSSEKKKIKKMQVKSCTCIISTTDRFDKWHDPV